MNQAVLTEQTYSPVSLTEEYYRTPPRRLVLPASELTSYHYIFRPDQITVEWSNPPRWAQSILDQINRFLVVPQTPDGDGAAVISPELAAKATRVLARYAQPETPRPSVVPSVRGGIQFEWHTCDLDFEFELLDDDSIAVYGWDHDTDEEVEDSGASHAAVQRWTSLLATRSRAGWTPRRP